MIYGCEVGEVKKVAIFTELLGKFHYIYIVIYFWTMAIKGNPYRKGVDVEKYMKYLYAARILYV